MPIFSRDFRHSSVTLITWKKWLLWTTMVTGLKRNMSVRFVAFMALSRCVVRQSLSSVAIALGLLVFSLPSARCQLNPRPPLTSRVAGVTLVATLESLSVGAAPAASSSAAEPGGLATSAPVAIVTRWVVPSHLTTLRLTGFIQGHPQSARPNGGPAVPPSAAQAGEAAELAAPFSKNNGNSMEEIQVGLPMVTQDPVTSSPGTRSDNLNVASSRGPAQSGLGIVSILVQAL
jgi:hypothetical protein